MNQNSLKFHQAIANLKAACDSGMATDDQIVGLCKEVVRLNSLRSSSAPAVAAPQPIWTAEVYVMPEPFNVFDPEQDYCLHEQREGANFGIDYVDGTCIQRCVVADPGDEDGSWNNDQIPQDLKNALGWKDKAFFPDYLPISLLETLASDGEYDLVLPGATIHLVPMKQQGLKRNMSIADLLDNLKAVSKSKFIQWAKDTEAGKHCIKTDPAEDWYKAGCVCQECGTVQEASECFHRAAELGSKLAEHKLGWA